MQGRTHHPRKARIQHRQPWLVEPLDFGGRGRIGGGENAVLDDDRGDDRLPPLVREWLGTLKTAGTRRAYRRDVVDFLHHRAIEHDQELLVVRPDQVAAWRDFLAFELEHNRLAYQTVKRRMAAASSLYDNLNRQGHVITNPVRQVRRPRRPEAEQRRDRWRAVAAACPLARCPAVVSENPVPGVGVGGVAELLARLTRPGRQLTLW